MSLPELLTPEGDFALFVYASPFLYSGLLIVWSGRCQPVIYRLLHQKLFFIGQV